MAWRLGRNMAGSKGLCHQTKDPTCVWPQGRCSQPVRGLLFLYYFKTVEMPPHQLSPCRTRC